MTSKSSTTSARGLTRDDLSAAAVVLGDGLAEMSVYEWVLGEHVDDRTARSGLARVLLRPLIAAGHVVGVDGEPGLLGLLVWYPTAVDATSPGTGAGVHPDDLEFLTSHPEVARRLLEFWNRPALPSPEPGAVSMPLAAVIPEARSSGVIRALVRTVEDFCIVNGTRFYVWTGLERLRDLYVNGWGVTEFATVEFDEQTTLYGLTSERPPPVSST
ncbi:hypothetical protein [Gordonia liuliyuniae]|uniref:N-acetyltransferase domain-containing protein n=1 Tax=Gordonia liuliyuniae TaxID=2911517 RepID=A0ABS9IPY5_9ACTN|nr:hypothetical protein [Gordonia liuliyuniae]MCF8587618.1 hypothetical protein [Gordonia liuliyuniae]